MRTTLLAATIVAIGVAAFTFGHVDAQSQTPPRAAAPSTAHHGVAVIDIRYIFNKYSRFQQGLEGWKHEMENTRGLLKKDAEGFEKQVEKLKALKPGTKEFKTLEEELARRESDQKVQVQIKEKEFNEKRAKLYLTAYQDISEAVKNYSDRNGISLVLDFNGAPVDQNNPQAIQGEILKLVVYQNGIDITPIILDDLNRRAATPVARPPVSPNGTIKR